MLNESSLSDPMVQTRGELIKELSLKDSIENNLSVTLVGENYHDQ
jgi:hypothetical protein